MVICRLRWSRIEIGFTSCCHLAATMTVWQSGAILALKWLITAAILASLLLYLRDRLQTFYHWTGQGLVDSAPQLQLAPQFARMDYRGKLRELRPPQLRYFSELLLVLSFRSAATVSAGAQLPLVLWPDSLSRRDDRRLRRYLRFDLGREPSAS